MTNRPVIGLVLALLVEASHWVRFRWDFDDETCSRAWQLTSIGIGLATAFIWLDGDRYTALPNLLTWMPPLLLPMQFIQAFGLRESLPLHTFSFLAKQHQKRNQRLGLTKTAVYLNFGNIYFISTMVASALGSHANASTWGFLVGTVTLTGWMLLSTTRRRPWVLILPLLIATGMAVAGQLGLQWAQGWINGGGGNFDPKFNPNTTSTLIGRPGVIHQSPDIVWRLRPLDKNAIPSLLRTATYNTYHTSTWGTQKVALTDFKDLDSRETSDGDAYYLLKENADLMATHPTLPRFNLRGAAAPETPLPLPGDAASLRDFELDGIDRNTFGCIRVFPKEPVIDGTVLWRGGTNPEKPPISPEDLKIPISEQKVIRQIAEKIGLVCQPSIKEQPTLLRSWSASNASNLGDWTSPIHCRSIVTETDFKRPQSLTQKLTLVRNWFQNYFKYTRNLTIYKSSYVAASPSGIAQFLTRKREGHCEYFATAAALLLREAGVPTRYATGYAVAERDPKRREFVIRGTHGHAWCRVWDQDAGVWFDFDTTPPDWLGNSTPVMSPSQWFDDGLKRLREDFFLWRNRPSNHLAVTLVMSSIVLGVGAFVVTRLWKSKRRVENLARFATYEGPIIRTPLHDLEPHARKQLGYRPLGLPYAEWLARLSPILSDTLLLEEAIALHQRLRFDPQAILPEENQRLKELTRHLSTTLNR